MNTVLLEEICYETRRLETIRLVVVIVHTPATELEARIEDSIGIVVIDDLGHLEHLPSLAQVELDVILRLASQLSQILYSCGIACKLLLLSIGSSVLKVHNQNRKHGRRIEEDVLRA